jgi:hypothetical protein
LARLCLRQVERRMILDYWDFTMGSAFSATSQLPKRGALQTLKLARLRGASGPGNTMQ